MNEILQLIGSIASILGVPLAVYLFLRGQVQKYSQVRREIVKRLSHQIGEGRKIGLFELQAIIDSLSRENRLRSGAITPNSVVEDLIAETVSSPLLESTRKDQISKDLAELHSVGKLYEVITRDRETLEKFMSKVSNIVDQNQTTEELKRAMLKVESRSRESSKMPELFGAISSLIAGMAAAASLASFSEGIQLIPKLFNSDLFTSLLLGIGSSLLAVILASFLSRKYRKDET